MHKSQKIIIITSAIIIISVLGLWLSVTKSGVLFINGIKPNDVILTIEDDGIFYYLFENKDNSNEETIGIAQLRKERIAFKLTKREELPIRKSKQVAYFYVPFINNYQFDHELFVGGL